MAGGAAVLAAGGSIVGSRLGYLLSAHLMADVDGFKIEKIASGRDPAILFIDGFLTEGTDDGAKWLAGLREKYAEHTAYYVHWEGQTLRDLGASIVKIASAQTATAVIVEGASLATKAGAAQMFSFLAPAAAAIGIVKHPWNRAVLCSERTGVLVAEALMRCVGREFILAGHSLGARAVVSALCQIASVSADRRRSKIIAAHLRGGADGSRPEEKWTTVASAIEGTCYNYHSSRDQVLKYAYQVGTLFQSPAIGSAAISVAAHVADKIVSVDVTEFVDGHGAYKSAFRQFVRTGRA